MANLHLEQVNMLPGQKVIGLGGVKIKPWQAFRLEKSFRKDRGSFLNATGKQNRDQWLLDLLLNSNSLNIDRRLPDYVPATLPLRIVNGDFLDLAALKVTSPKQRERFGDVLIGLSSTLATDPGILRVLATPEELQYWPRNLTTSFKSQGILQEDTLMQVLPGRQDCSYTFYPGQGGEALDSVFHAAFTGQNYLRAFSGNFQICKSDGRSPQLDMYDTRINLAGLNWLTNDTGSLTIDECGTSVLKHISFNRHEYPQGALSSGFILRDGLFPLTRLEPQSNLPEYLNFLTDPQGIAWRAVKA